MHKLSTREKRHQRTRKDILDAARHLVMQKGVDGLSMRAIARRIDYSPAGLYEYFSGKDEIVQAICWEGHQRLTRALLSARDPQAAPAEQLLTIGLAYIAFALSHADYYLLMFTNPPAPASVEGMLTDESAYTVLLQVIEQGIASGDFITRPGLDRDEMAYNAWALVHGAAMLRITYLMELPHDFDHADRQALQNFTRGLRRPA